MTDRDPDERIDIIQPDAGPQRVYCWLSPAITADELRTPPRVLPAIRIWGDVILELIAERRAHPTAPPIGVRRSALFGWLGPAAPPVSNSRSDAKVCWELLVDPKACAAARFDLVDPLYRVSEWRRLSAFLADRGHAQELVEEELAVLGDWSVPMSVNRGRLDVESTEASMLNDVIAFFEVPGLGYLRSWHALKEVPDAAQTDESWEIIIPRTAVIAVFQPARLGELRSNTEQATSIAEDTSHSKKGHEAAEGLEREGVSPPWL